MGNKGYYLIERLIHGDRESFKFICGSESAPLERIIADHILPHQTEQRGFIMAKEIFFRQEYSFKTKETKNSEAINLHSVLPELEEGQYFLLTEKEDYAGCGMDNPYPKVTWAITKYETVVELLKELPERYSKNLGRYANKIHILKPISLNIDYSLEAGA